MLNCPILVAGARQAGDAVVTTVAGAVTRDEAEAMLDSKFDPLIKAVLARLRAALPVADFLLVAGWLQTYMCALLPPITQLSCILCH